MIWKNCSQQNELSWLTSLREPHKGTMSPKGMIYPTGTMSPKGMLSVLRP
jgi:hypothetical protein